MKTKLSLFLITLFFSANSFAITFFSNGIQYNETTATTVEVIGFDNTISVAVNIPSNVIYNSNNYVVNKIYNFAFAGFTNMTSITIPNTVTHIGEGAFQLCWGLLTVNIPNSVTVIENNAFINCYNLVSVIIPNSIISISSGTFNYCTSLASITIPNSVTTIGDYAFNGCTSISSVTIPNSVTTIGNYAFNGCTSISSVTIPNSVTYIGSGAFFGCSALNSISIPNSVTHIEGFAFSNCTALTTINIPNSVTYLGNQILEGCTNLNSITVNWTTPLPVDYWVFYNLNYPSITLNVPSGTESLYDASQYWTDFNIANLGTSDFSSIKLKFAPNPTTSSITFTQEINSLEIFDLTGKKVKTFENANSVFDVADLEKGIYLLKGKTIEGSEFNEKLIKE